jgi:hypothetical protein
MPLTVYGPVTPISPAVRVTGVLPSAEVNIQDNGHSIGHAVAANPGELLVPLTTQPTVGHSITAVQKTSDGTSEPSAQSIPVVDVPDPLPVPVTLSGLNTCMSDIWADGLVPGARVITLIGGHPFGSSVAPQTTSWLGIDPTQQIAPGRRADIHEEAQIGATTRVSKSVQSPNIPEFQIAGDLLPPPVLGPLVQCDTLREFLQAIAGAGTTITNEGQSESWLNPAAAFHGYGAPPLKKGNAVATQAMARCKRTGQPVTLPVAPAGPPPAPIVTQDLCPQTLRLEVSNLAPGGILHLDRAIQTNATTIEYVPLGDHGITYPTEPVDLPPDIALNEPAGPVFISLYQSRCAGGSPRTLVKVAPVAGPFGPPKIVEPLLDCSRGIPIKGAHPGAIVQAVDASSGIAMSDPVSVTQADFIVTPWFPLAAGEKVLVRQRGCNADGDSPVAVVKPLPLPLPIPNIVEPVRPQAPWVKVTGVVPGARLYLLVNNQLRPGSFDVYADTGIILVTGAPLAEKDSVLVIQKLCDATGPLEGAGPGVIVKRGNMKVSVAPAQVARGTTKPVVVTALDADTRSPVSAEVLLNGQHVGTTGIPFAYSPRVGDPNPTGIVRNSVAYFDASFTINLVAVADPTWTLTLHAGPAPVLLDNIRIDITEITWKVTPDWIVAPPKTVTVTTPTPPTAIGSVALPIPTGQVKRVTVEISGKASTQGGNLNGYTVPRQNAAIGTDTKKVAFQGSDELIAWVLVPNWIADQNGGVISVDPAVQGITP